jgi:LPS sulfotransferase NodH
MHVSRWNKEWQTKNDTEYLTKALNHGTTPNGVFGAKIMRVYWDHVITQLNNTQQTDLPEPELLSSTFPNVQYIWITRRNKVRQAVSWCKFLQGVAWYWTEEEPQKLAKELEYKYDVIDAFIHEVACYEAAWQEFFDACGISPHVVVYEDFIQTYESTALQILEHLKIPTPRNLIFSPRKLKKQADDLSEKWVKKYGEQKQKQ